MKNTMISPYLHSELTGYMDSSGLSVREMAAKCGLTYNYMRRVINGQIFPRRKTLHEICNATGIDFPRTLDAVLREKAKVQGEFVTQEFDAGRGVNFNEFPPADPELAYLTQFWPDIGPADRKEILAYARFRYRETRGRWLRENKTKLTEKQRGDWIEAGWGEFLIEVDSDMPIVE